MNQSHGERHPHNDMPLARMFKTVVMKFRAPSNEARQKIAMLMIRNVCPAPKPGPATSPKALKGA